MPAEGRVKTLSDIIRSYLIEAVSHAENSNEKFHLLEIQLFFHVLCFLIFAFRSIFECITNCLFTEFDNNKNLSIILPRFLSGTIVTITIDRFIFLLYHLSMDKVESFWNKVYPFLTIDLVNFRIKITENLPLPVEQIPCLGHIHNPILYFINSQPLGLVHIQQIKHFS